MPESIKKRILVVEDEVFTAMNEKIQLENYGYDVKTVTTGEQAVEAAHASSDIDLILMDINLGNGIDGTEAAEIILKDHDIPIIFLSSHTDPEVVEKTEKITSYGYVVKNSSATVLDASIKMAFKLFDAKNAIAHSEEKYRTLFETMSPGVVYQGSDGAILSTNPAAERLLGLSADQMNGKTSMDPRWRMINEHGEEVLGPDHPSMVALRTGKTVGPVTRGVFIPEREEYIWLLITAIPLFRSGEDTPYQVYASFDDISEQRRAEVALREQRDFSESLIETAQTIILVLDTNGCIVQFNPYTEDLLGYSLNEVKGQNWLESFVQPEDAQTVTAILQKTADDNQNCGYVNPIVAKDGRTVLVEWSNTALKDADGHTIGVLATGTDITETQRLHASLELRSEMLRHIGQAAIATDVHGNVIFWNRTAEMLYGFTSENAIGKSILELTTTTQTREQAAEIMAKLSQGERWHGEFQVQREDGRSFPAYVTNAPIFDENGHVAAIIGISTDITERKLAEEEIKRQLSEKELLLREVHHRVKNNISTIESLLSLQAGSTAHVEVKSALQNAISRVQSMRVLYDKLLISTDLDELSMRDYVESLVDSLIMVFDPERSVTVETHLAELEIDAKTAVSIGIILNELLTNVFKYAFHDRVTGRVSITINEEDEGRVTLFVEDNGVGFDERTLENDSPGFGLTIVKMLTEQLDGTLRFENDNGTRTTLGFPIPAAM